MGVRGPIPKRSSQRRRRNSEPAPQPVVVQACERPRCDCVVGHVRYDPAGRWCSAGHEQVEQ